MKHAIPHDLTIERARLVTDKAWEAYSLRFAEYSPKATWTTPTEADVQFTVKGITLRGSLGLTPKAIEMDLDVPFLFRPFRTTALNLVEREVNIWLAKGKAGEF
ncbi:MAG: polyhydroxyalkanoic acid system family protein [Sandaracinaceae bacterium]|nr:polyhydroxyalkanoic acid system family protein [Sandaracinaceae bacterium]